MKIFNNVPRPKITHSKFDLSHDRKFSMEMGKLTPILVQEIVPGDTFNINTQAFIRFAPLVAPVMHRINVYTHYFFVPCRILWKDWEAFITGDLNVGSPNSMIGKIAKGSLGDYMGLPIGTFNNTDTTVNNMPARAYFQIFNDYYRDENLQGEIDYTDSQFLSSIYSEPLLNRAWEKDYFTSALPWTQKGEKVLIDGKVLYKPAIATRYNGDLPNSGNVFLGDQSLSNYRKVTDTENKGIVLENIAQMSIEVEELRRAEKLQRWLEKNARAGTRYVEHLLSNFGVVSPDARLQRAEYIGGGKQPVVISEVLNTTGTAEAPQGTMAGHGISVGRTNMAHKYAQEHGYIIGIMSVLPETAYMQGIPKMFKRVDRLDYYWPDFAQLGEQAIENEELFMDPNNINNNKGTFGYQSRYAEYKYMQSSVHGEFRDTLDFWHMGRKFVNLPTLTEEFIQANPRNDIFAVTEEGNQNLFVQVYNQITANRPMPYYNIPSII